MPRRCSATSLRQSRVYCIFKITVQTPKGVQTGSAKAEATGVKDFTPLSIFRFFNRNLSTLRFLSLILPAFQ